MFTKNNLTAVKAFLFTAILSVVAVSAQASEVPESDGIDANISRFVIMPSCESFPHCWPGDKPQK
ncbi:hypothetical protein [Pseudoalteromonas viridis]|uniref:Uncharacterized protein n=1 Tax=Pseudoalteromonas viridis TaxID=339617 RepID=A0ABX7V6G3_9GAMM|nr:hypothetical protein [Pseudoalteromonas viridis]QTL36478.1 hypothetical protein J5X90_05370 [Pseudoalteromonas viridis]